ncbi:hypothetical protein [Apilactobacillus xinyiensis]|uniref:hypothetical protein n=1 Tax=Apilactobacillus xinyiensis TaxID=2841032 RepID=UPI002010A642|nr:hypothetical protein [Apilactobacillus xinyiensis]MCL0330653.1 hypothetical protein [Apilactobacillus xinyiensis]
MFSIFLKLFFTFILSGMASVFIGSAFDKPKFMTTGFTFDVIAVLFLILAGWFAAF